MSLTKSLGWYARRLSVMGPEELAHRLAEQWAVQSFRWKTYAGRWSAGSDRDSPAGFSFCLADRPQLPALPWAFDAELAVREGLADGRWPALGFEWQWHAGEDSWHRAPDTGAHWPRRFFASVPYRPGNPYGDVRVAWEPARLQQLVGLALLANSAGYSRRNDAVRLLESELLSWLAANRPYQGIHYISAMECALRLIAVCHALDMVRGRLVRRDEVWSALLAIVGSHAHFIEHRLSRHSSAGNHTIAECAGLLHAGILFPEFAAASRWRGLGLSLLVEEANRQILEDGGTIEQAFWYLLFVADLCGLACALLEHRGEPVPPGLARACERARDFLAAMADETGGLPSVGDRDDGHALGPWLRLSIKPGADVRPCRTFTQAGYSRVCAAGPPSFDVLFDHGPLGMAPLFAHGHADALSVIVRIGGRDVLLDPGTFMYSGSLPWRRHFRATHAHNTISVDGRDQAVQDSPFSWSAPYSCRLLRREESAGHVRLLAQHDGYRRLGNIIHWRGIAVRPAGGLLVWDYLSGRGDHAVQLNWHALALTAAQPGQWTLDGDVLLEIEGADMTSEHRGGPPEAAGGWLSTRYGQRHPIPTVQAEKRGPLPCEFLTYITPRNSPLRAEFQQDLAVFRRWRVAVE
jgi:hypothetical protein